MGDFSALLIALGVCNTAGSKEKRGEGKEPAVQMYSKEVILKCDSAVAAVVDLHDWLWCCREVSLCFCLLCRRSGHKWGYPTAMLKKKKR